MATHSVPGPAADPSATIAAFLRVLRRGDQVFEIRAPQCPDRPGGTFRQTVSGYFDVAHIDTAAELIVALDAENQPAGIYVTLNPVNHALVARAAHRLKSGVKSTTTDADILHREWLLLDIDPKRPADISSTEAEMRAATTLAARIKRELGTEGWPDPIGCMSGNGAYLLYRIELPNDAESTALVRGVLTGLAARFNTDVVEIDQATFNAARIVKVIGTHARKGDSIAERPHRRATFLRPPTEELGVVPLACLQAARPPTPASAPAPPRPAGDTRSFDRFDPTPAGVRGYLERHGARVLREHQDGGYTQLVLEACPITGAEGGGGTSVTVRVDAAGKITYHNLHNRAVGSAESWQDLRDYFEPGYRQFVESLRSAPRTSTYQSPHGAPDDDEDEAVPDLTRHRPVGTSRALVEPPLAVPVVQTLRSGLTELLADLPKHHGKKYVGLPTVKFPTLDERLCGIRGFIITAAAPGVGKTTLGLNLGLSVVQHATSDDVVFVFFSFEMSRPQMQLRLLSQTSGLPWRTLKMGLLEAPPGDDGLRLTRDDRIEFNYGVQELAKYQDRVVIIDRTDAAGGISSPHRWFIDRIDAAKAASGASRVFVLIDSLQTMPVAPELGSERTTLDLERFIVGELGIVASHYPDDPVLVISEQAKSSLGKTDMISVLGSGRAMYSPDVLMFLQTDPDEANHDTPRASAEVDLWISKARDGMVRGPIPLTFSYLTSRFDENETRVPFIRDQTTARPRGQR